MAIEEFLRRLPEKRRLDYEIVIKRTRLSRIPNRKELNDSDKNDLIDFIDLSDEENLLSDAEDLKIEDSQMLDEEEEESTSPEASQSPSPTPVDKIEPFLTQHSNYAEK